MRALFYISLWFFAIPLLYGCATTPEPEKNSGIIAGMRSGSLEKAQIDYVAGRYQAAAIEFRKILDAPAREEEYRQAQLGLFRTCMKMGNPSAAAAQIHIRTEGPLTSADRELLALLGEALLREERLQEAALALQEALNIEGAETANSVLWKAPCQANLATVWLKQGKTPEAAKMYEQAALLFEQSKRLRQAHQAHIMADRLNEWINTIGDGAEQDQRQYDLYIGPQKTK